MRVEALAEVLRLPRLPVSWRWRPVGWPIWNHTISRAVCFWVADGGRNQMVLDELAAGRLGALSVEAPASRDELIAQLSVERDVARGHLARLTDAFYDPEWRRQHRGGDYPESHLWSAAAAFLELDDALQRLDH